MRDTVLAALVIAALLWSVVSFKSLGRIGSGVSTSVAANPNSDVDAKTRKDLALHPLQHHNKSKGEINNERHRQFGKTKIHPESSGSSGDAAEIERLSSIYAPEAGPVAAAPAGVTNSANSAVDPKNTTNNNGETHRSAIPGIPVNAYVQYKKNSIFMPTVTAPTDGGLRVFLNCMEVKPKGLVDTGERKCKTLLPQSLADRRPIMPQGPQPF